LNGFNFIAKMMGDRYVRPKHKISQILRSVKRECLKRNSGEKGKGKVHPRTGHEVPGGEYR
jgi:hypothetical protein